LPTLILKLGGVLKFSKKQKVEDAYKKVSSKSSMLMKSYCANFTKLLGDALGEQTLQHVEHFFLNGPDVVRCHLPFKTYAKKLATSCGKISVMYSRLDKNAIILGFNALKHLVQW